MTMKITTIKLVYFRNHEATELPLAPLTIVKGRNNSGKTSIRHAIEVALTGRAEFTDRGGRGLTDAIRVGQKAGVVELDVEGIGEITRTLKPSGSSLQVADWTGTATAQQELLNQKLGADADLISALLNVGQFISLPPKEQKDMLFKIARPEISIQQLMVAINDWAEKQGAGNLLDELRSLIQIPETVGPDWLDQAYKLIFEARKEAKKVRDTLAGKVEGMEDVSQELPPLDQLPELEKQIATLEAEREKLREKVAAVEAAEVRRTALADREPGIRSSIKALGVPIEASGDPEKLKVTLGTLTEKLDEARQASYEAQGELRAIDDALPKIKGAKGDCPLAPGVVSCPMTAAERKELVKDLNAQRKKLVAVHEKAMKDAAAIETQKEELAERIWAAEQVEKNAARLEDLEKQLESVQAELATLPEPIGIELARSEISTLDERIRNGHELSAKMKVAAGAAEKAQAAREDHAEAVQAAENLEHLVTLFGPTGIKQHLLTRTMGAVIERAAENLSLITGGAYELDAEADPDFHLVVNGNIELRQLSTSERMRVGIACAEALAHASGLRLLVIDDLEILDLGNRGLLSEWLRGRMADHDTILVLSTAEEAKDPGVEGVASYWVEAGKVERIGAMAHA
jgi:DNA repair exonuclease SbcCD ATPase subunit